MLIFLFLAEVKLEGRLDIYKSKISVAYTRFTNDMNGFTETLKNLSNRVEDD